LSASVLSDGRKTLLDAVIELALSKGTNKVGEFLLPPEDEDGVVFKIEMFYRF
jgi:hypothetical protein